MVCATSTDLHSCPVYRSLWRPPTPNTLPSSSNDVIVKKGNLKTPT